MSKSLILTGGLIRCSDLGKTAQLFKSVHPFNSSHYNNSKKVIKTDKLYKSDNLKNMQCINILIRKSPSWNYATVMLCNNPIYTLYPSKNHTIQIMNSVSILHNEKLQNYYTLIVNDDIVYKNKKMFQYDIDIKLNNNTNPQFASFYKYI